MKKILAILTIATLLCSCAAEKRLARFLERHPELHRIDTVLVHDTIILPAESNTVNFTLSELIAMDSIAKAAKDSANATDSTIPTVSVATDRSLAAITPKGNGTFDLTSTAKQDTIVRVDTCYVPSYLTEYKEVPVEVHKLYWWENGLMYIGALALVIILIITGAYIVAKFVKPI